MSGGGQSSELCLWDLTLLQEESVRRVLNCWIPGCIWRTGKLVTCVETPQMGPSQLAQWLSIYL